MFNNFKRMSGIVSDVWSEAKPTNDKRFVTDLMVSPENVNYLEVALLNHGYNFSTIISNVQELIEVSDIVKIGHNVRKVEGEVDYAPGKIRLNKQYLF